MDRLEQHFVQTSVSERLAHLTFLFRSMIPDLYTYFEEEEVEFRDWAVSWTKYLFARELPVEKLWRLWDTYFALDEGFELHVYVCIAILQHYRETLEELEQSEIKTILARLPSIRVPEILQQAVNIKQEMLVRQVDD